MEKITVSGVDFLVAVVIHPVTDRNEFKWDVTVRSHQYERIAHVDIIALRKAYDELGYTGELKIVLRNGYSPENPCAVLCQGFVDTMTVDERADFISRVNKSSILDLLKKY